MKGESTPEPQGVSSCWVTPQQWETSALGLSMRAQSAGAAGCQATARHCWGGYAPQMGAWHRETPETLQALHGSGRVCDQDMSKTLKRTLHAQVKPLTPERYTSVACPQTQAIQGGPQRIVSSPHRWAGQQ